MASSPPESRVRLSDIARQLQISKGTVSRALRDDPRISRAVRKRVQRIAAQMGYRPDPMLAALAQYRRGQVTTPVRSALAWINCWPEPRRLRSIREFDLYWTGAAAAAELAGYRLEEFAVGKHLTVPQLEKILVTRNIRGLLLPTPNEIVPAWDEFHWDLFCVVRLGYSLERPAAHGVSSDQLTNGLTVFQNAWSKGYRRIGLVTSPRSATRPGRFAAGVLCAQLNVPAKFRLPLLLLGKNPHPQLAAWLKKTKPDAVVSDVPGLCGMLAEAGHQVPNDFGLAAASVFPGSAEAGINQNSAVIGEAAVQLLDSLIHHNERGIPAIPREILIKGRWQDGRSLPSS